MPLTGRQKKELHTALRDAFRTRSALKQMLAYECDRNLDDLTSMGGLSVDVFTIVEAADAEGWIDDLLSGALTANPGNPLLRSLHDRAWPTADPTLPIRPALETIIRASLDFVDVDTWLGAAQDISRRVCRIRAGRNWGSAFLVGPQLVLTNHHVIEELVGQIDPPLSFQFDYRVRPDGSTNEGVTLRGAADDDGWLLSCSPPSTHDFEFEASGVPTNDELDHALLRLGGNPGNDRGWVDLRAADRHAAPGQPLAIVQHPAAGAMKLALDTDAVIGVNDNKTRITYRTNTLPGSSGSPCFDFHWRPIALHHSGDPAAQIFPPKRNEGVPLVTIVDYLVRHGVADALPDWASPST